MHPSVPTVHNPTNVRMKVLQLAVAMAVITYIHRVCLAQAAPTIERELGLSKVEMGWIFTAFTLAYAVFQIPGGWLADRWGPRRVLSGAVAGWSLCVAASGWAGNAVLLAAARFGFGAGQAAAFPAITKSFVTWLPARERGVAQGVLWLSARWGGAFTPLMVMALMNIVSWRIAFQMLAMLGFVWALTFWWWYRDDPRVHGEPNEAELAMIAPLERSVVVTSVPWMSFASSGTVWLLCIQYFCLAFSWIFYITWLPTYLLEARELEIERGAFLAGFPLFFGGLGCVSCGFALRKLEVWLGGTARARRWMAGVGSAVAGCMLIVSVHLGDPLWAMMAMGMASFANDLVMPPSWGTCMDVGGPHAASLSACMNTAGNLGAMVAPPLVAYILTWTDQNWTIPFYTFATANFVAAACWVFIRPADARHEREV